MRRCLLSTVAIFFAVCLTACGFHLRGAYQLPAPMFRLYLQTTDIYDPFVLQLQRTLVKMKVVLTATADQANVVLVISHLKSSQTLVSSSTTSQVNTYALTYSIDYTLLSPAGKVLIGPQGISSTQNYTISSDQATTGSSQEQQLLSQLYQDVIAQLFNRLNSKKVKAALGVTTDVTAGVNTTSVSTTAMTASQSAS